MYERPHIAVVDPARASAELAAYNRMVCAAPVPLTYHLPQLMGTASLAAEKPVRESLRAVVVLGSASSVHDDDPWQKQLADWLSKVIAQDIPVLGICFGHQLLAAMFGGKVDYVFGDRSKHLGARTVRFVDEDGLPQGWRAAEGPLLVSHREQVSRLPSQFRTLAVGPHVLNDGMRHESLPVFGLQAHPEASSCFEAARHTTAQEAQLAHRFGHKLVDDFLCWAAQR